MRFPLLVMGKVPAAVVGVVVEKKKKFFMTTILWVVVTIHAVAVLCLANNHILI